MKVHAIREETVATVLSNVAESGAEDVLVAFRVGDRLFTAWSNMTWGDVLLLLKSADMSVSNELDIAFDEEE